MNWLSFSSFSYSFQLLRHTARFSMRRGDFRCYVAVAVVMLILFVIYKKGPVTITSKHDFQTLASTKLQLPTQLKPSSCKGDVLLKKRVSVIVSSQAKEGGVLAECVNSIVAYTDHMLLDEIIISIDSQITKKNQDLLTQQFAAYHSLVSVTQGPTEHRIKNKLLAGHMAKGDVVVFIDDNVVVSSDYLNPLLEALQDQPQVCNSYVQF